MNSSPIVLDRRANCSRTAQPDTTAWRFLRRRFIRLTPSLISRRIRSSGSPNENEPANRSSNIIRHSKWRKHGLQPHDVRRAGTAGRGYPGRNGQCQLFESIIPVVNVPGNKMYRVLAPACPFSFTWSIQESRCWPSAVQTVRTGQSPWTECVGRSSPRAAEFKTRCKVAARLRYPAGI